MFVYYQTYDYTDEFNRKYTYFTFQKVDNFQYILFYLKFNSNSKFRLYIFPNNLKEIPIYGNVTGLYNSFFYMNLTYPHQSPFYIQVQLNTSEKLEKLCLSYMERYYFGRASEASYYECSYKFKKSKKFYIFYYTFYAYADYFYMYLGTDNADMNISIINTKTDEYSNDDNDGGSKNESKDLVKTIIFIVIISLISVAIVILFFIYIFIIRPIKKMSSEKCETLK